MSNFNTYQIAEYMLSSGKFYTAASLASELDIHSRVVSGKLFNIRVSKKYKCEITTMPNRTIKVISICGSSIARNTLWNLALFNKPFVCEVAA
jgi:hypothetical protein